MLPEIIKTERLTLRPHQLNDMEEVYSYASDPDWYRYLPVSKPYLEEHAVEFLSRESNCDRRRHPSWAIEMHEKPIGGINFKFFHHHRVGEVGYSLAKAYWNQGLITEASTAVIQAAFDAYPMLVKIRASSDVRNTGSLRVMEKLGMVREGLLRSNRYDGEELVDEIYCGILRSEWEAKSA